MSNIWAYVDTALAINVAIFVATLVFSTKIKDVLRGVPAELRTGLDAVEADIKAKVSQFQTDLIHKVVPTPAPVLKPPVAPVTPV